MLIPGRRVIANVCLWLLAAGGIPVAAAHHGWSFYEEPIVISATIIEVKMGNPHDRLIVEDDSGQEWNLLLGPRTRNQQFGFDEDIVSVGDEVEITGRKHPRKFETKVHTLTRGDEAVYQYYYPNGQTSQECYENPRPCHRVN